MVCYWKRTCVRTHKKIAANHRICIENNKETLNNLEITANYLVE